MNNLLPNLRHLRAFRAAAHARSISRAAPLVHLSQPAITQAISKLEERVGAALFDRHADGVVVTDIGSMFLNRVERALAFLERGAKAISKITSGREGRPTAQFDQLMTVPQLRALVSVSGAQNFSLAARQIGISQPSLHRAARDLEQLAGVPLYQKSAQGIVLTDAGEKLVLQVKLAFAELKQAYMEIEEKQGHDTGQIVVGSLPLARAHVLQKAINLLTEALPDLQVRVIDGPYGDLLHGLRHGEIDVMIGALRYPAPIEDITQTPLFSASLSVIARQGHPLAEKSRITSADLAAFPWVVPRQDTPTRAYFDSLFPDPDQRPRNIVESSSLVLIRGLLLDTDRLTLLSAHQIKAEREFDMLTRLAFDTRDTERDIGLTCRSDWQPTSNQQTFMDFLRAASTPADP
ncbi:MAG: LysR family transcriptional regulator [Magnetospiraceae bacterium]